MSSTKALRRIKLVSSQLGSSTNRLSSEIQTLIEEGEYDAAAQKALSAFLRPPRYQASAKQLDILEKAQTQFIQVDGIQLRTYTWNADAASTVIVPHGFGTSVAFMAPLINHLLSSRTCRIVAVDHAGHGESADVQVTLGRVIAGLKSIVEKELERGKRIEALIGHSVGATAFIILLHEEFERFSSASNRPFLVAINPPLQPTTLFKGFCAQHSLPFSLVDKMREAFIPSPEDVLKQNMTEGKWAGQHRILLVQDTNDKIAQPMETADLAQRLKDSRAHVTYHETAGLGHFRPVRDAAVLDVLGQFFWP